MALGVSGGLLLPLTFRISVWLQDLSLQHGTVATWVQEVLKVFPFGHKCRKKNRVRRNRKVYWATRGTCLRRERRRLGAGHRGLSLSWEDAASRMGTGWLSCVDLEIRVDWSPPGTPKGPLLFIILSRE